MSSGLNWFFERPLEVDNLVAQGFQGTAEEVFEAAKAINEAEYQRVVFTEFADALIGKLPPMPRRRRRQKERLRDSVRQAMHFHGAEV